MSSPKVSAAKDARRRRMLDEAWLGDAVLALWARRLILRENGTLDADRFSRMSSNQFLTSLGDPAEVEAQIGRVFEAEGLDAAFAWLEANVLPLHLRQEAKRAKGRTLPGVQPRSVK